MKKIKRKKNKIFNYKGNKKSNNKLKLF
jgi:hypothetical protein